MSIPTPIPNRPNQGVENSPFRVSSYRLDIDKNVKEHIWELIGWLCSDAMNNRTGFAQAPMSERRSSTVCAVVERPDHHYGDDLAILGEIFTVVNSISFGDFSTKKWSDSVWNHGGLAFCQITTFPTHLSHLLSNLLFCIWPCNCWLKLLWVNLLLASGSLKALVFTVAQSSWFNLCCSCCLFRYWRLRIGMKFSMTVCQKPQHGPRSTSSLWWPSGITFSSTYSSPFLLRDFPLR